MKLLKSLSTLLMLTVAIMSQQLAVAKSMALMGSQSSTHHTMDSEKRFDRQSGFLSNDVNVLSQHCLSHEESQSNYEDFQLVLQNQNSEECCDKSTDCSVMFCVSLVMITATDNLAVAESGHYSNYPTTSSQVVTRTESLFRPPIHAH